MSEIEDLYASAEVFDLPAKGEESAAAESAGPWSFGVLRLNNRLWWAVASPADAAYTVWHGVAGGKLQSAAREVAPKARRSLGEQLVLEVGQEYRKKIQNGGYRRAEAGEDAEIVRTDAPFPMLNYAVDLGAFPDADADADADVLVQPKLDGMRVLATLGADGPHFWTRTGRALDAQLARVLGAPAACLLAALGPGAVLDGELLAASGGFQQTISIGRSVSGAAALAEGDLTYNIFAHFTRGNATEPFEARRAALERAHRGCFGARATPVRLVETVRARASRESLDRLHAHFTARGFEGVMVYAPGSVYREKKRVRDVAKYKTTQDMEGRVVAVEEGRGKARGTPILHVETIPAGARVKVAVTTGELAERRALFDARADLVGRVVTFKYQDLTDAGVPRMPVFKAVRDYE